MTTGLTDLDRLEREAFRRFYDDGLVDFYIGIMLVIMGVTTILTSDTDDLTAATLAIAGAALAITIPLLVLRRHLLKTRLGTFRPGPQRRRRIKGTWIALLASVVVGVIAFGLVASTRGDVSADAVETWLPVIWFLNGVVVFGAGAYFLDVPRFYSIGVLWGIAMPLLIWPDVLWDYRIAPWLAFGMPGSAIAAVGLHKFLTFLQRYPKPSTPGSTDA